MGKKDKPEKLPLFARRGVVNGKRQNYLLRYECPVCQALYRGDHRCKGPR